MKATKAVAVAGGICILSNACIPGRQNSESRKMNVLFLLADDLRWNSLGCAGTDFLVTPNIDALARDGIRFSNACVTTSISMVSRASLLTGQYMSRHGIREFGVQLSEEAFSRSYPAVLRGAGWWTGYVGKYGVGGIRKNSFDFSREYEGKHWIKGGEGDSVHVTEKNKRDALEFLRQRPKDKPFMLTVGFFATHAQDNHPDQYLFQPGSEKLYSDLQIPVPSTAGEEFTSLLPPFLNNEKNEGRIRWHWRFDTPEKYQRYMKAYYRMLTELDSAVGEIIKELKAEGVYENTLIVFMGDNGYFHSEHGLADKWYPYEESIRVPLIVHDPRIPAGKRNALNEEFVLNTDIAPYIVSSAGLLVPDVMQGRDFSSLYLSRKKSAWRQDFYYEHPYVTSEERIPSSEALVTHSAKYIIWPHYNYEEYFDLLKDRRETNNEIGNARYSSAVESSKSRFEELREKAK
ncbi:MAG: sulfatase-like hydrolase/transferase [Bacteroidales bacterium]|nr:sulfatase-like hydrolase/transferase [Bacteroidales bacterium]